MIIYYAHKISDKNSKSTKKLVKEIYFFIFLIFLKFYSQQKSTYHHSATM